MTCISCMTYTAYINIQTYETGCWSTAPAWEVLTKEAPPPPP